MTNETQTDRLAEVLHQMATFQDGNAQPQTIALINELADIAQSQQAEIERLREALALAREKLIPPGGNWTGREPHWQRDAYLTIHAALNPQPGKDTQNA